MHGMLQAYQYQWIYNNKYIFWTSRIEQIVCYQCVHLIIKIIIGSQIVLNMVIRVTSYQKKTELTSVKVHMNLDGSPNTDQEPVNKKTEIYLKTNINICMYICGITWNTWCSGCTLSRKLCQLWPFLGYF